MVGQARGGGAVGTAEDGASGCAWKSRWERKGVCAETYKCLASHVPEMKDLLLF